MSFFAGVLLILLFGDVLWWWRAQSRVARLPAGRVWRAGITIFACAQAAGLVCIAMSRMHGMIFDALLAKPILAAVYLWHVLALVPMLLIWALIALGRGVLMLARLSVRLPRPRRSEALAGEKLSRREFFAASAVVAPAVLTVGAAALAAQELATFRIRRLVLPVAGLPKALDGLTIAHVSDLHVGRFTQGKILEEIIRTTNELAADLVVLPGDLINYALSDLPAGIQLVQRLESKYGVYLCEGNHDLIEDPDRFRTEVRAAGLSLLVNAAASIQVAGVSVQLLGLRWGHPDAPSSREAQHGDAAISASMRELLALRDPAAFPILLAHHPHAFDFAGDLPLTLAGHTHGGQLMFSPQVGFGPWLFRYWSGLYERGGRKLVVSNGVGNWFPLRIGAPAEIIHLTLRHMQEA